MGYFDHDQINEHEAKVAHDLFGRIVDGERETLSDEQRADMGAYLLATWHKAAEAVMRPIQSRLELERELEKLRPTKHPFDLDG